MKNTTYRAEQLLKFLRCVLLVDIERDVLHGMRRFEVTHVCSSQNFEQITNCLVNAGIA